MRVASLLFILIAGCSEPAPPELKRAGDGGTIIDGGDHAEPVPPGRSFAVFVEGAGSLTVFPDQITASVRPDIFVPGWFSLFDLLVHLAERGEITLDHHFDAELDTHVIDSLNGSAHWWYDAWYDGGWPEPSVHRMDYFPVKDPTHIGFETVAAHDMQKRFDAWRAEVDRRRQNDGIIIPTVSINVDGGLAQFTDVEVTAHDLRPDVFALGTLTAADIILSLGDQGLVDAELEWVERMGTSLVQSFFIDAIGEHQHSGHCGFVYEVGEDAQRFGNHIHLMSDIRVLQHPEYALFYWIELGPC